MHFFYNLFIRLYYSGIILAAPFNKKARQWIEGRRDFWTKFESTIVKDDDYVWFHCASLGEFEQGRPVMERFRKENPGIKIVLTFFSPSGFEIRKNYDGADYVFYMPLDTPQNAERFVKTLQPCFAVFVKYEYWFNHMRALYKKKIPIVYISAIFRKKQMFFRWWGSWYRKQLISAGYFFVQDSASEQLLNSIDIKHVRVSGDTRFDRVYAIRENPQRFDKVEKFVKDSVVLVAGSTWPADEKLLTSIINKNLKNIKFIVAPHEIHRDTIDSFISRLNNKAMKYSTYDDHTIEETQVLIIDRIGMLSNLYQYASVAYIGGGFGAGIHNILEAATWGMPVIFGPNYKKFAEARDLVKLGGAFPINNEKELLEVAGYLLSDYNALSKCSAISKKYVESKKGASDIILVYLNTLLNSGNLKIKSPGLHRMN
ncbi:MAG: 3-deoxy-D-manno-octulosonic acid transferase [Bacteroidales bacterium]|nr:3-deoxy-D-manno-octulosonic acid transferase [Bacteroidales bacterium]